MADFPEGRHIPGYGTKYLVRQDGVVYREGDGPGYVRVGTFDDPPRVALYRNGKRWRPRVSTLVERLFGEGP